MRIYWVADKLDEMVKACEKELEIKHYQAIERAIEVDWYVDKMELETVYALGEFVRIYLGGVLC